MTLGKRLFSLFSDLTTVSESSPEASLASNPAGIADSKFRYSHPNSRPLFLGTADPAPISSVRRLAGLPAHVRQRQREAPSGEGRRMGESPPRSLASLR